MLSGSTVSRVLIACGMVLSSNVFSVPYLRGYGSTRFLSDSYVTVMLVPGVDDIAILSEWALGSPSSRLIARHPM